MYVCIYIYIYICMYIHSSEATKGTLNPKDNSLIRKETSTSKGFHSTSAA